MPRNISPYMQLLFEICLGSVTPTKQIKATPPIDKSNDKADDDDIGVLDQKELEELKKMVLLEFAEAFQRNMKDETDKSLRTKEPGAFDVYLARMGSTKRKEKLLAIPDKESIIIWQDGKGNQYERQGAGGVKIIPKPIKFLANLAGVERTLVALSAYAEMEIAKRTSSLMHFAMKRTNLFSASTSLPSNCTRSTEQYSEIARSLNEAQRIAVQTVSSPAFQSGFFCILGPPGCGKTTTMVAMIRSIMAQQSLSSKKSSSASPQLIVVAPSNAAVANIALKLFESISKSKKSNSDVTMKWTDMCVFGSNVDPSVHFLSPLHRSNKFRMISRKCQRCKNDDGTRHEALCRELAEWLKLEAKEGISSPEKNGSKEFTLKELAKFCPYVSRHTPHGNRRFQQVIRKSKIIFCTLNGSGSNFLRCAVQSKTKASGSVMNGPTLLLDEAGQATEAEFYIAATFPGIKRMIVVGDPKQLPATVMSPLCSRLGFKESWLGHVYKLHPDKVHMLDTQYRMDPRILQFANEQFYDGRIKSGSNVLSLSPLHSSTSASTAQQGQKPQVSHPFLFIDMSGKGAEKRKNDSWLNRDEANVIYELLQADPDIQALHEQYNATKDVATSSSPSSSTKKQEAPRIIIITPYRAQVELLQSKLSSSLSFLNKNIDISTVDSFQGQEGDIVVVSTVRTKRVGFVDDEQRLNVALTRAKRILRVVGDLKFFKSLLPPSVCTSTSQADKEQEKKAKVCKGEDKALEEKQEKPSTEAENVGGDDATAATVATTSTTDTSFSTLSSTSEEKETFEIVAEKKNKSKARRPFNLFKSILSLLSLDENKETTEGEGKKPTQKEETQKVDEEKEKKHSSHGDANSKDEPTSAKAVAESTPRDHATDCDKNKAALDFVLATTSTTTTTTTTKKKSTGGEQPLSTLGRLALFAERNSLVREPTL